MTPSSQAAAEKKPAWLRVRLPSGETYQRLKAVARTQGLATVCEQARCPNIGECWGEGTATFMLMGDTCTRGCQFCAVKSGNPAGWLDADEPEKLASVIQEAGWRYVVLTSVDRDDLPDGGAAHLARCIQRVREVNPSLYVEVLIPDFQGDGKALETVLAAGPHVVAQNLETVARLTHPVRDRRAGYQQTLALLAGIKQGHGAQAPYTKSSLMLGLGETDEEIHTAMAHLRAAQVDVLTLGQYLQPTPRHWPVARYVPPEAFATWRQIAENQYGFLYCAAGPLVRSSYRAGELLMTHLLQHRPTA